MGMVLVLRRVDDQLLDALRATPSQVLEFTVEDDSAFEAGDALDFDKAWHAVHFLLTGDSAENNSPLSLLRLDYEPLGEDLGYGPAQIISAGNMKTFYEALSALSDEALRQRYDPTLMARADVYLGDTLAKEDDGGWDYVSQSLPALRRLSANCAASNSSAIVVIV